MIGAMPAVAVRHERRHRKEKRGRRPSQLQLQLGRGSSPSPTPSPLAHHQFQSELYFCGKVAALHAVVGSMLLGIVVLVVGLVQLSPGAEAAQHRYYLMGAGAALLGAGVVGGILRCIFLHWYNRKLHSAPPPESHEAPTPSATTHGTHGHPAKNGVNYVDDKNRDHHHHHQHRTTPDSKHLKQQQSVTSPRREDNLVKQPSATSDT